MVVLDFANICRWLGQCHLMDAMVGRSWAPAHVSGCSGLECYEVFSCLGMKDATAHLREPLMSLAGAVFFSLGIYGTHHGCRRPLQLLGTFLLVSATLHLGILLGDALYVQTCNAYPRNVIEQTLIQELLPPSPLTPAAQTTLKGMSVFTIEEVQRVTDGFNVLAWYYALAGSLTAFLAYTAYEAHYLGDLAERGPLGLGVHFGIAQWDEVLNHDAIRRRKAREMKSQFIDDANLPLKFPDVEAPFGYMAASDGGYGAAATDTAPMQAQLAPSYVPKLELLQDELQGSGYAVQAPERNNSYFEEDYQDNPLESEVSWEGVRVAADCAVEQEHEQERDEEETDEENEEEEELRMLAERLASDELQEPRWMMGE